MCAGRRSARGSRRAAGRAAGRPAAAGAARQAPAISRRLRAARPPPRSAPFPSVHHAEAEANSGTLMAPSPSLDSGRPEKPRRRHRVPPRGAARGHQRRRDHRRVAPAVCRRPRSPGARVPGWRRGRSWMAAVSRRAEAVSGGRRRAGRHIPGRRRTRASWASSLATPLARASVAAAPAWTRPLPRPRARSGPRTTPPRAAGWGRAPDPQAGLAAAATGGRLGRGGRRAGSHGGSLLEGQVRQGQFGPKLLLNT